MGSKENQNPQSMPTLWASRWRALPTSPEPQNAPLVQRKLKCKPAPSSPRGRPFLRPPIWISVARGTAVIQVLPKETPSFLGPLPLSSSSQASLPHTQRQTQKLELSPPSPPCDSETLSGDPPRTISEFGPHLKSSQIPQF